MNNCPTCQRKLEPGQQVCQVCGPIDWPPLCPECRRVLNMKKRVCPDCGWRLRNLRLEKVVTIVAWAVGLAALGSCGICAAFDAQANVGEGIVGVIVLVGFTVLALYWIVSEIRGHE
jgi:RNA polymerase subunit RPABC4/transcription elongation factor Spt4